LASALRFERNGVRIAGLEFGGDGPPVLLLHGLAGHAGEWAETASWLTERCRVIALDARGHGGSERRPADLSRATHVADAAFAVTELRLPPVVVVGQSLGGQTALLLAAEHPDLVRGLVLADAGPGGGDDTDAIEANLADLRRALERWPLPFPSRAAAVEFFGGAEAWADGLEQRDGGWWPRFDVDVMVQTLRDAASRAYWDEWSRVRCPVLVVRAGKGSHVSDEDARAMVERARVVELAGAGHDVHLERPAEWRAAVSAFLDELE
jgi:pimeloyl-ACP methyl ester carboxylesterase